MINVMDILLWILIIVVVAFFIAVFIKHWKVIVVGLGYAGGLVVFVSLLLGVFVIGVLIGLVGAAYLTTWFYGIFVDFSIFESESIFTIPYSIVWNIGITNPLIFWPIAVALMLAWWSRPVLSKKYECVLHKYDLDNTMERAVKRIMEEKN